MCNTFHPIIQQTAPRARGRWTGSKVKIDPEGFFGVSFSSRRSLSAYAGYRGEPIEKQDSVSRSSKHLY